MKGPAGLLRALPSLPGHRHTRLGHRPRAQARTQQACPGDPSAGRARPSPDGPNLAAAPQPRLPDPGLEPERGSVRRRAPRSVTPSLHVRSRRSRGVKPGASPCAVGEERGSGGEGAERDICFPQPEARASEEGSTAPGKPPAGEPGSWGKARGEPASSPRARPRRHIPASAWAPRFSPGGAGGTAPA